LIALVQLGIGGDLLFLVGGLERIEHLIDAEITDDMDANASVVSVADRNQLPQPFGRLLCDTMIIVT
jgi:hypothetical protein